MSQIGLVFGSAQALLEGAPDTDAAPGAGGAGCISPPEEDYGVLYVTARLPLDEFIREHLPGGGTYEIRRGDPSVRFEAGSGTLIVELTATGHTRLGEHGGLYDRL